MDTFCEGWRHLGLFLPLVPEMTKMFWTSQVVKSGSTETRVEKRIVITADSDADKDKVNPGAQERSLMREAPLS